MTLPTGEFDTDDEPYSPGPSLPAAPPGAVEVADDFAHAWARPRMPAPQWLAGITPLCTSAMADAFGTTDPANVPATTITGPPTPTGPVTADAATFAVPTNAGTLSIGVTHTTTGWRVSAVTFTRSAQ